MNKLLIFLLLAYSFPLTSQETVFVYKDKNATVKDRVEDLLKRMTLEEKVMQLNQMAYGLQSNPNNLQDQAKELVPQIGSVIFLANEPGLYNMIQKRAMEETRLGIPILFGYDIIHGYRTVYPISLAQACSWNPDLVRQACAMAAKEGYRSGVNWTFSPMIDVARDARWGRVAEGYGEDPYTNAVFCVASVKGFQGDNLADKYTIASCLKHYVGYGLSEGGRDYQYTDVSAQSLWETYLVPYEAGIKAGAATVMSGFNDISGIPASANYYTLTEILKGRWGHQGFVISDWGSVEQLVTQGVAANKKEAAKKAFLAGVDMDMVDNSYNDYLAQLVNEGKIPVHRIDDAVKRILRIKFMLGLFDNPYIEELPEKERFLLPESKIIAEKLAEESMVLLKNEKNILPISDNVKNIAIIGPVAKDKENIMGNWSGWGKPEDVESVYEGMEKEFKGKAVLNYAKGCDFDGNDGSGFIEAYEIAQESDVIVLCLGEMKYWSGENGTRSTLALPVIQEKLVMKLRETGKPVVLVLSSGRPLELMRMEPLADAIIEMWQPGVAGGSALAGILSGGINPSGKLSITFPLATGQIPVYYCMRQSSRPYSGKYQDIPSEPLYWFGHGLSYTNFEYGNYKLSANSVNRDQKLIATVDVKNTGKVKGKETVMWYISDRAATISRPVKELKYFEKQELAPGETKTFTFEIIPSRDLSFPDADGNRLLEAGEFYLIVNDQMVSFEVVD